jgi:hypothetical protein
MRAAVELSGSAAPSKRAKAPASSGRYGVLNGPEEHRGRGAKAVVAVDVVVDQVAGEDQGLEHSSPVLVQSQDRPVLVAHDPEPFYQGLHFQQAVRDSGAPGVPDQAVQSVHVEGTEEDVPEEMLGRRQAVWRLVPARDEPEDVVWFEIPFAAQDFRHVGVFDPASAKFFQGGHAGEVDPLYRGRVGIAARIQQ